MFGSAYADMRLVPYLMAVEFSQSAIADRSIARPRNILAAIGLIFFATRTVANTISLGMAADDQTAKLRAIDAMPEGARVITLTGMTCNEYWPLLRNSHIGAMVIVRRDGFSNDQWVIEGVNLLDLKYRAAGYFAADPSQLVRPNDCRDTCIARSISRSRRCRAETSTMSGWSTFHRTIRRSSPTCLLRGAVPDQSFTGCTDATA